jgi:hypothetical protein
LFDTGPELELCAHLLKETLFGLMTHRRNFCTRINNKTEADQEEYDSENGDKGLDDHHGHHNMIRLIRTVLIIMFVAACLRTNNITLNTT